MPLWYNLGSWTMKIDLTEHRSKSVVKVVIWSRGLTWRSQVGANPIPIPHPTNLALFGHKITLYTVYIQPGGSYYCRGLKSEQGVEPPPRPPHFNHWSCDWCRYCGAAVVRLRPTDTVWYRIVCNKSLQTEATNNPDYKLVTDKLIIFEHQGFTICRVATSLKRGGI